MLFVIVVVVVVVVNRLAVGCGFMSALLLTAPLLLMLFLLQEGILGCFGFSCVTSIAQSLLLKSNQSIHLYKHTYKLNFVWMGISSFILYKKYVCFQNTVLTSRYHQTITKLIKSTSSFMGKICQMNKFEEKTKSLVVF